jgi:hypothetical protein
MRIQFAHIRERSTTGGYIDFAVFQANANDGTDSGRADVLRDLTMQARMQGLTIDPSALAYNDHGRTRYYGDRNLVSHLARRGISRWTHYIDV